MAVSYISKPFKSSPYTLPIDLDLFGKVMSIKQGDFDKNAQKIQANIDNLGLLDVIKEEDRNYLNSKINNLVSGLNNLGGLDLSDPNTFNQIEGIGSDIYTDKNVINAISSTRSIRKLQSTYEKYKTDPKLNKLYSEINENWDMRNVQSYLNDKTVGTRYSGPTTPTPYTPYRENHLKAFEKLKTDLKTTLNDHGLYYSKTIDDYITPERIMSMAADLLTPQEREQMKRDGWYMYRDAGIETLTKKGYEQFYAKKQDAERLYKYYQDMADAAVSDPKARRNYNTLASRQKEVVDSYNESETTFANNFINKFKENPEETYYQLYSSDYFRGLGNRFSVNRSQTEIIPNQAEMFKQRLAQSDQQFRDRMNLEEKKIALEISRDEEKNKIELLKIGKYRHVNPFTGEIEYLDLPGYKDGHLITQTPNIEDPDNLKITKSVLEGKNADLKIKNDELVHDYISRIAALHPELAIEEPSSVGKGFSRRLIGQEAIAGFNQQPGIQMEDFRLFETIPDKEGFPVFKNQKQVQEFALKNRLSMKQLEFFANQWKNYEAMALGKGETVPDLVDGFPDLIKQMKLNNEVIRANNKKLETVVNEVYDEFGFSKEVADYINSSKLKNPINIFGVENTSNDPLSNFQRFTENIGRDMLAPQIKEAMIKRINEKLKSVSTRDVFGVRTLSDAEPLIKSGELSKLVVQEMIDNKAEPYGDSPELGEVPSSKNIRPRMIGKASDGTGRWMVISDVEAGSGDNKKISQYKTYLSADNAALFGLEEDPYESINYSVRMNGRTDDIPIYANKNLSVFVNIAAYGTGLNDDSSLAQVVVYELNKDGQKTGKPTRIKVPATEGRTPSESFRLVERAIEKAGQLGLTYNDFITYLENIK